MTKTLKPMSQIEVKENLAELRVEMANRIILKITLLGDGAVGKTSIRTRFMGRGFTPQHMMTIGADFAAIEKEIEYNGKMYNVTFQIWDLAGQQRFTDVRSHFYRGSLGGLCIFDITRPDSFHHTTSWINEIWQNNGKGVVPIVLIANKSDLRDKNSITNSQAETFSQQLTAKTKEHGFQVSFVETSAKTGMNIDEAFDALGKTIFAHRASQIAKGNQ